MLQELTQLTPEELEALQREIEALREKEFEATPEMLAAIEEGRQSLRKDGGIPIDEVLKEVASWNTKSP